MVKLQTTSIINSRHPSYTSGLSDWQKWRLTYEGGERFRNRYLKQFSVREDQDDFYTRRSLTPIPGFAKSAINNIRDSIFQRMRDITRNGGSDAYRQAISGLSGGVDRRGSTMNAFLGTKVLPELLVMGRMGVYVDNSVIQGVTLADTGPAQPYIYPYAIDDILSWSCTDPEHPSQFKSILLRDHCLQFDGVTGLPVETFKRFRLMWIDDESGNVMLQFYNENGVKVDRDGNEQPEPYELRLNRIPFVMLDLGDSLIKDVCEHQIALLNLESQAVWYALQSNFPFYVEQRDLKAGNSHLKPSANADGTATTGGQGASDSDIKVGTTHGRGYDKGVDRPAFIAPPDHPLRVSMDLQDRYEAQIRKLVNLAVQTLASRESAESKEIDNQGLESGLSFIGLVLENAERQIADFWASYESIKPERREIPTIKYPDRYSLKTDSDRIDEAERLSNLIFKIPSREAKKEIAKQIVETLLGGRVDWRRIDEITAEIQNSDYLTSDPDTIIAAVEAGLCGEKTGSIALGFSDGEYKLARRDHLARVMRIAEAQNTRGEDSGDPAARGVDDLSADPAGAANEEREAATEPSTNPQQRRRRTRGRNRRQRATGSEE